MMQLGGNLVDDANIDKKLRPYIHAIISKNLTLDILFKMKKNLHFKKIDTSHLVYDWKYSFNIDANFVVKPTSFSAVVDSFSCL